MAAAPPVAAGGRMASPPPEAKAIGADVVVVGASNQDLISYVPRLPKIGETLHGHKFVIGNGGKGANQAVQCAKLGAHVTFVGMVGEDVFGRSMLDAFHAVGMDTRWVGTTSERSTGVAPIAVDERGSNSIIIVNGANDLLAPCHVAAAVEAFSHADICVVQLEVNVATSVAALQQARACGAVTILNPAPAQADLPPELFAAADIVCPNEPECALLTGVPIATSTTETSVSKADRADLATAADALLRRGRSLCALVTLGSRGALLAFRARSDSPIQVTAVSVPRRVARVVDTTGAGDSFVGSFAFWLARVLRRWHSVSGAPFASRREAFVDLLSRSPRVVEGCVSRASWCASMSVEHEGTQSSFPKASEIPVAVWASDEAMDGPLDA